MQNKGFVKVIAVLLALICIFYMSFSWVASYYENKCLAFSLENANYSKGQIIFIGDSITDGYPLDSYYGDLNLKTYNRGIGGDRTSGVYRRLKVSLYDLKPTKVILMIGINDINSGETNDEIIANYSQITKSPKRVEGINLLRNILGNELVDFIENYYENNIVKSKKYNSVEEMRR